MAWVSENLLHRTFNRLTAIGIAGRDKRGRWRWLWRCSCGKYKILTATTVKSGQTRSCGCWVSDGTYHINRTVYRKRDGKHWLPEYGVWSGMKARCENAQNPGYKNYGGRGVALCERWQHSFDNFYADMGKRPSSQHSIERKNNDGIYEAANCYWATDAEQKRNQRRNRIISFNNETMCARDWEIRLGYPRGRIHNRIVQMGWSVQRALTTPVRTW